MKPYLDSYLYPSLHPTLFHDHHQNDHTYFPSYSHYPLHHHLLVTKPVHVQEEEVLNREIQDPKAYPAFLAFRSFPASRMVGIHTRPRRILVWVVPGYGPRLAIRGGLLYLLHHRVVGPSSLLVGMPSGLPS